MTTPDDARTIDPDRTLDPATSAPTLVARPTPTPATARFSPGAIIGGRYRLVSLLGRGGMGEVYRADDLTLDQPVALKFLPEGIAASDARLAQFHNELRVARQVSHKNVCRLYDLGDADGRRFLTMEYVDGEDLSASLRRFGRMPPDKAVQIARQLCAGVAAAHERGVLHRDLKPANVMLDGNGDVRITDFGIATAAADVGAEIAGTPQYMAPELLAGRPASIKSDLYALGLVLFEVFTGKRLFDGKTLAELRQAHDTAVTTPSAIVRDLDPAIERAILRCLEKDPDRRPASAITVAASLPGADPIAAALAAGETPSPELLVAAGESEAMPVRLALTLALACVGIVLVALIPISKGSVANVATMPLPRDVLADRADQILRRLGYTEAVADREFGLSVNNDYLRWAEKNGPNNWWDEVRKDRPSPISFWYRTGAAELAPVEVFNGRVTPSDPPMNVAGMRRVTLDATGRLLDLRVVPPQLRPDASSPATPAWEPLFEAAGLDEGAFTSVPSTWVPRDFSDATAAWEGPMPGRPNRKIRVEAAAFGGRVVSFQIVWPWTEPDRVQAETRSVAQRAAAVVSVAINIVPLVGGVLLARRNLRLRRADTRGAARFGIFMFLVTLAGRLISASHSTDPGTELGTHVLGGLGLASLVGGYCWVYYLAVEPYGRRFWPDALLGWSRLWSGRLRDPRVGRELLIGMTAGALALLIVELPKMLALYLGWRMPQFPWGTALWVAASTPGLVSEWLNEAIGGLQSALIVAMIFLVLRLFVRRPRVALAAGVFILLLVMNVGQIFTGNWVERYNVLVFTALLTVVPHRFGLVATAAMLFVDNVIISVPLTPDLSAWWSTPTLLTLGLVTGLVAFAFYAARGGEPLFGKVVPD